MAVEDKRGSLSRHHRSFDTINDDESIFPGSRHTGSGPGSPSSLGQSVFDYVEKHSAKSPIFYNFGFSVTTFQDFIIQPFITSSMIKSRFLKMCYKLMNAARQREQYLATLLQRA